MDRRTCILAFNGQMRSPLFLDSSPRLYRGAIVAFASYSTNIQQKRRKLEGGRIGQPGGFKEQRSNSGNLLHLFTVLAAIYPRDNYFSTFLPSNCGIFKEYGTCGEFLLANSERMLRNLYLDHSTMCRTDSMRV